MMPKKSTKEIEQVAQAAIEQDAAVEQPTNDGPAPKLSEEERAETRWTNAHLELKRLKAEYSRIEQEIADKQEACTRLQAEHDLAVSTVNTLSATGQKLQAKRREGQNRLTIARGTGEEAQEEVCVNAVLAEIAGHETEYQQALQRQEETEQALAQLPVFRQEITTLQADLKEADKLYAEMYTLWEEQHAIVGRNRAADLRQRIEECESAVSVQKKALEEAEQALMAEQMSIESELGTWPVHVELVRKTHGFTPVPQTPERHILEGWLSFVEVLRVHGPGAHITIGGHRLPDLLDLSPNHIFSFCQHQNWRETVYENARGERSYRPSNQRVDQVRHILKQYK